MFNSLRSRDPDPPNYSDLERNTIPQLQKILLDFNVIPPATSNREELIRLIKLRLTPRRTPNRQMFQRFGDESTLLEDYNNDDNFNVSQDQYDDLPILTEQHSEQVVNNDNDNVNTNRMDISSQNDDFSIPFTPNDFNVDNFADDSAETIPKASSDFHEISKNIESSRKRIIDQERTSRQPVSSSCHHQKRSTPSFLGISHPKSMPNKLFPTHSVTTSRLNHTVKNNLSCCSTWISNLLLILFIILLILLLLPIPEIPEYASICPQHGHCNYIKQGNLTVAVLVNCETNYVKLDEARLHICAPNDELQKYKETLHIASFIANYDGACLGKPVSLNVPDLARKMPNADLNLLISDFDFYTVYESGKYRSLKPDYLPICVPERFGGINPERIGVFIVSIFIIIVMGIGFIYLFKPLFN